MNGKAGRKRRDNRLPGLRPLSVQILGIAILTVVWVLLWDSLTVLTVLTGILVALGVIRVFYLPAVELSGRFNVIWAGYFLLWLLVNVVGASIHVAWTALGPRRVAPGSIVAVDLNTRSDLLMTVISLVNGVIPGSFVTEVDRVHGVLYIHTLGANTDELVEKARADAYTIERLVIMMMGSVRDLTVLNAWREERGLPPVIGKKNLARMRAARARREAAETVNTKGGRR
ncbi:Na+/H+ antiporter subunit E [Brevibacterium sp. 50QC2O2]|uniref:Na+/H+ antiporter subunit E n=1 Tax=Brevibacterium TaxID=1696 RepID=UPI00211C46DE|nr:MULTISPECIES: Na+/H+ antiporter subunit E [unclassified Brevibacterium]MCQ9369283.1 Na+/H+ antiporter subunit E [Brevibacterium sp. 91QC2O2]MCQ9386665.1 Na+/H+ antiporter subunit E [Brevibacterium sp. 68QC2CO]MCQ9388678.1 Na+/H+ antiporter subunit E [Brevibacterium sp. 50QC2O2]